MSDEQEDQEKKVIIDEGWKSQVEAEKEAARRKEEPSQSSQTESPSAPTGPLPPPSLTEMASGLYLHGMVSLGLLPSPGTDKPQVHLDQAKHTIDTLRMLQEKTEGNRTPEESQEMDTILHQLRLAYVGVQEKQTKDEG